MQFSSVTRSCLTLWSHELQHTRPPCPSPTPRVHPNPCPLCWWCHPTTSSSVVPFSSCPQSFPASGSFQMNQALHIRLSTPKYWSFSFNISPSNEHPGLISFRMDWLDLLIVQGTLRSLLQHHSSETLILQCPAFFIVQLVNHQLKVKHRVPLWWSSGWDSMFPMQVACVRSLVRELDPACCNYDPVQPNK